MQTSTHDQKQIDLTTTSSAAQAAKPSCDRILRGIDQHAEHLRVVRQLDGPGPPPRQRIYPGATLERLLKKQLTQAKRVYAAYKAGPCGFGLARQLTARGVTCFVIRPMKLDLLGKGVNTDKTDAAELVSRQCEQLRRERQRLNAMGKSSATAVTRRADCNSDGPPPSAAGRDCVTTHSRV